MIKSFSQVPAFQKEIKHLMGDRVKPVTSNSYSIRINHNNMYAVRVNGVCVEALKSRCDARLFALKHFLGAKYKELKECPRDFVIDKVSERFFLYKIINKNRLLCYKLRSIKECLVFIHYHQVFEDTNTKKECIE